MSQSPPPRLKKAKPTQTSRHFRYRMKPIEKGSLSEHSRTKASSGGPCKHPRKLKGVLLSFDDPEPIRAVAITHPTPS